MIEPFVELLFAVDVCEGASLSNAAEYAYVQKFVGRWLLPHYSFVPEKRGKASEAPDARQETGAVSARFNRRFR